MYFFILFLPFYFLVTGLQSGVMEFQVLTPQETGKLKDQVQKSLEAISRMEGELRELKEHVLSLKKVVDKRAIKDQWETDIASLCLQTIEKKYPFSESSQNEASLEDVQHFFHPQGSLWKFFDNELKQFIRQGPDEWEVVSYQGKALLPLTPQSLEWFKAVRLITESLFSIQAGPQVQFSLLPYPDQGPSAELVEVTRLTIGGQTLDYQMGPMEWKDFIWPGTPGSSGATLKIKLRNRSGITWEELEFAGRWGWFRLLDKAYLSPLDDSSFKLLLKFESQEGLPLQIRYDLKPRSSRNPFNRGTLSPFSCLRSLW